MKLLYGNQFQLGLEKETQKQRHQINYSLWWPVFFVAVYLFVRSFDQNICAHVCVFFSRSSFDNLVVINEFEWQIIHFESWSQPFGIAEDLEFRSIYLIGSSLWMLSDSIFVLNIQLFQSLFSFVDEFKRSSKSSIVGRLSVHALLSHFNKNKKIKFKKTKR